MTSRVARWGENHPVLFLCAVFAIVYLPGLHVLRIVQDDWSIVLYEFGRLSELDVREAFSRIFTNQWYPHPRIYWVSWTLNWMSHGLTQRMFGLWGPGQFFPILALHLATTILVFKILRDVLEDRRLALVSATLCLVYPAASAALFMITNWFFVIPPFFIVLLIQFIRSPFKSRKLDLTLLTATALISQFSGEQAIPLVYFILSWFLLTTMLEKEGAGFGYAQIRLIVPGIVCLGMLAAYYLLFVKPYVAALTRAEYAWGALPGYLLHYFKLLILPLYPLGVFYGRFSVSPSWITVVCSLALLAFVALTWTDLEEDAEDRAPRKARRGVRVALFLVGAIFATALPCLYGALNGYRPVPELRYMYAPGLFFAALIPIFLSGTLGTLLPGRWLRIRAWAQIILTAGLGSLMIYQLREIWGTQKLVDERIWSEIEGALDGKERVLVAHNPNHAYLIPAWFSAAASDFKCNYCISDRLRIVRGIKMEKVTSELPAKPEAGALFVVYRHGPKFADLLQGRIDVSR